MIKGYNDTLIKDTWTQGHMITRIQGTKRDTWIQRNKDTWIHGYKDE